MDTETLHSDIKATLSSDPIIQKYMLPESPDPRWKMSDGLLLHDNRIYVPDANDLRLRVLKDKHDHILSGHFGQNKTISLIRREYVWPELRNFVKDYCKSCTKCQHGKSTRHKPYGNLRQLPVPELPWNSISMDFIEQLPPSLGFTAILVVVDRFTKQAIFIPTTDDIDTMGLAQLFIKNIFTKHGVPSHVTSNRGSELVSRFFRSLGIALNMKLHFTSGYHEA
jgi:hypothetical protein